MKQYNNLTILAIETSCDDTCIAILEIRNCPPASEFARRRSRAGKFKILSNIVSSQTNIHKKWGGVYPTLAKREHQKNLPVVLKKVLNKTRKPKIDVIAVTVGPGLEPCLWTGVNFAKELAEKMKLPIVPVNHIEAHIFANFIRENSKFLFPAICLVVSGGHTQLILMKDFGKYKILGETRDDAAGECLDKVARILGLGYPGGPIISKIAKPRNNGGPTSIILKLPRPMIYQKNYDFSFSGLKTAGLYHYKNQPEKIKKSKKYVQAMASEVQQAIVDVLIQKTIRSAKEYKARAIILGGGVAANDELRKQFKKSCLTSGFKYLVPAKKFCTDNAAMIAVTAYFNQKRATKNWKKIRVNANLKIDENY